MLATFFDLDNPFVPVTDLVANDNGISIKVHVKALVGAVVRKGNTQAVSIW